MSRRKKKPISGPTAEPPPEAMTGATAQPTTESTNEPVAEPKTEPTTESTNDPVAEPKTEPKTEPTTESTAEPSIEQRTARRHPHATHPPCPRCGAPLYRVHRNLLDRLRSLIHPRRRYCCRGHSCGWEGTLPYAPDED